MKLDFIPVKMRLPLKFGAETIDSIQICHVEYPAYGAVGRGETPLSVAWAWPSTLTFALREELMCKFCQVLAEAYPAEVQQHPMTEGYKFLTEKLDALLEKFNRQNNIDMPHLAALICASAFDIAMHDAYGLAKGLPTYKTYNKEFMDHDLAWFYNDDAFKGLYPEDFFVKDVPSELPVWHLVGGKDLLYESERTGNEPEDGYPVSLEKWIERDGLKCLKIKLTGSDAEWDYNRVVAIGKIALKYNVEAL